MSKEEKNKSEESLKDQVEEVLDDAINKAEAAETTEGNAEAEKVDQVEQNDFEAELKEELQKEKDKFLRLFAEFENFKKRTSKERIELFKTAGQDVMLALLPVLDDFDRALNEISKSKDKELLKGVELINNKLKEALKGKGLELINVKSGDVFDAEVHDAITQIPATDKKMKGKIVDVVEKGFKLGDRIIRHPKVVVGN